MQGIDAATHGTDFDDPGAHSNQVGTIGSARSLHSDISTLFSDVPSLVSDTDTSSVVSAPSIPSELAYQLASPTRAQIPSYTTTAESALESLEDAEPHWALAARLSVPEDNPTVEEALAGPDKELWWAAMVKEFSTLEKQGTFVKSPLPQGRKAMGCKWVLT
ncbi:unnamed protein product, partial [Rhizoctonia solani]